MTDDRERAWRPPCWRGHRPAGTWTPSTAIARCASDSLRSGVTTLRLAPRNGPLDEGPGVRPRGRRSASTRAGSRARRSVGEAETQGERLEEERRLGYVAWTRARRTLTLSYDPSAPSVFLREAFTSAELGADD